MTIHQNIVLSVSLLLMVAVAMFVYVYRQESTDTIVSTAVSTNAIGSAAEEKPIYALSSTSKRGISQQHRTARDVNRSSQWSAAPHSLYQHSSSATVSSCVAVPLQSTSNNAQSAYAGSSMSEMTYNGVAMSLQRRTILSSNRAGVSKAAATTTTEDASVVRKAPTIGGGGMSSVWQSWLDEYYASTGNSDLSGLEAWWQSEYGSGYTPDIYNDFAQWAVPVGDATGFCLFLVMGYLSFSLPLRGREMKRSSSSLRSREMKRSSCSLRSREIKRKTCTACKGNEKNLFSLFLSPTSLRDERNGRNKRNERNNLNHIQPNIHYTSTMGLLEPMNK